MNIERREKIKELKKNGKLIKEICQELGVSKGTVGYYLKNNLEKNKYSKSDRFITLDNLNLSEDEFYLLSKNSESKVSLSIKLGISLRVLTRLQKQYNCEFRCSKEKQIELIKKGIYKKAHNWTSVLKGEENIKSEYFSSKTGSIKKFILRNKLKEYICEECGINEWNNKKISLELDHIDGNRENNKLENLKLLCPNCHSQTDTWKGKNKKGSNAQIG